MILTGTSTPDYKITEASATATMPNPLGTDLAKLLGGRYSVDANVPVFPFVFATFGMFVETKLSYLHRLVFPLTLTQISRI